MLKMTDMFIYRFSINNFSSVFQAGVARAAYLGVVSFMFNGQRVHVAPPADWKGYDPMWS